MDKKIVLVYVSKGWDRTLVGGLTNFERLINFVISSSKDFEVHVISPKLHPVRTIFPDLSYLKCKEDDEYFDVICKH